MQTSYRAILRGDRLEWSSDAPDVAPNQAITVTVTIIDSDSTSTRSSQGARMAVVLAQLAALETRSELDDPLAWERDIRQERQLPGRDS